MINLVPFVNLGFPIAWTFSLTPFAAPLNIESRYFSVFS